VAIIIKSPKPTKYGLVGTGLFPKTEAVCSAETCKPKPTAVHNNPVPKPRTLRPFTPRAATKLPNNRWEYDGVIYPNFQEMMNRIPRFYTVLKVNNG
jgi:hypothetical protein